MLSLILCWAETVHYHPGYHEFVQLTSVMLHLLALNTLTLLTES